MDKTGSFGVVFLKRVLTNEEKVLEVGKGKAAQHVGIFS